jgi:hypothetical protein
VHRDEPVLWTPQLLQQRAGGVEAEPDRRDARKEVRERVGVGEGMAGGRQA